MKGIILAGGAGTRLRPLTQVTSKQLLPVYDQPMIWYPLQTLLQGGIEDILIIVAPDHSSDFMTLLGSGKDYGARFYYKIQDKPEGLAHAFVLGREFVGQDNVTMILGDNIFEDNFSAAIKNFKSGGHVFAKQVPDPERFGVVKFDNSKNAIQIEEKPKDFLSDYAITGLYIFDNRVVDIVRQMKPSARGELEITDIHNWYLKRGELKVDVVRGEWIDAGTFDSLLRAGEFVAQKKRLS